MFRHFDEDSFNLYEYSTPNFQENFPYQDIIVSNHEEEEILIKMID